MPRPRTRPDLPLTPFAEWLAGELLSRKSNQNKMAVATGIARTTVNAWFTKQQHPSPELCGLLAAYFHIPVEEVMVRAGHLPADYPVPEMDLPGFVLEALKGLSEDDLHVVAATARGLREVRARYPDDEALRTER